MQKLDLTTSATPIRNESNEFLNEKNFGSESL